MRRALRGAVGVLLAVGAVASARWALGQAPAPWLRSQQTPARKVLPEVNTVLSEGHKRLEEMKVELALLSDIATFPYYLGTRAAGETLTLHGYAPNDWVRQRGEELARRSTFLTVKNELTIQPGLSTRTPLRPIMVLQKEGAELLLKNFNDLAGPMHLDALPNGLIVVTGPVDSMESKLAISRIFRQLSGCSGVVNELVVQQVLRDGQRVMQVTKDGSMVVAPAALGREPKQAAAPLPQPSYRATLLPQLPLPPPPRLTVPTPTTLPPHSLAAQDGELRLPTALPAKPPNTPPTATAEKVGTATDALTPPTLPVKWSRPATSWESQMKMVDKLRTLPTPVETKKPSAALPTALPFAEPRNKPVDTSKTDRPSVASKSNQAKKDSRSDFAAMHGAAAPIMSGQRPGASEESEPKAPSVEQKRESPRAAPMPPPPLSSRPSHRWPPAYESRPLASNKGTPGVIVFDDPAPPPAATGTSRPLVPADLQRRVKSACGWPARDVVVERQNAGGVLVKVKVPNSKVEDQLTKKILAIPEMTAPGVRLLMDVGP